MVGLHRCQRNQHYGFEWRIGTQIYVFYIVLSRVRQANKHEIAQFGDYIEAKGTSICFLQSLNVSGQQFLGKVGGSWSQSASSLSL